MFGLNGEMYSFEGLIGHGRHQPNHPVPSIMTAER